jgi:hypothetical protein
MFRGAPTGPSGALAPRPAGQATMSRQHRSAARLDAAP